MGLLGGHGGSIRYNGVFGGPWGFHREQWGFGGLAGGFLGVPPPLQDLPPIGVSVEAAGGAQRCVEAADDLLPPAVPRKWGGGFQGGGG